MAQPPSSPIPTARAKVKTPWRNVLKLALIGLFAWALFWVGLIVWVAHGLEPSASDDAVRALFRKNRSAFHELRDAMLAYPERHFCLSLEPDRIHRGSDRFTRSTSTWVDPENESAPVTKEEMLARLRITETELSRLLALLKKTGADSVRLYRDCRGDGSSVRFSLQGGGGVFGPSKNIEFHSQYRPETVADTDGSRTRVTWYASLGEDGWYIVRT